MDRNLAQRTVVIGHKNPDTDSICSAICYAELKNKTEGDHFEARRAGNLNQETTYVLNRFHRKAPRLCTDVNPKIRNVEYRQIDGIYEKISMREAWSIMRDHTIDTLAVVNEETELLGIITMQLIAVQNMDVFDNTVLQKSHTSYENIIKTLSGTMVVGNENQVVDPRGKVVIGAASPDVLEQTLTEGDIVILSNRYESQLCAIEMGASLLIVCQNAPIGKTIQKLASDNNVSIMTVPYDTYAAGKLISQCAPVGYFMQKEDIIKFSLVTPVEDAISVMAKVRHRYFPILDENGKYCGMLSRRNVMKMEKRKIILVDHNEKTQAVEGFDQADILEIIDHHRIGSIETSGPVYFRNQPMGSTCSIIAMMYEEQEVEISADIAGLLLSAILSDTLKFTSPTVTPFDKVIAKKLAKIAGVDIDTYAMEMFEAGENLHGKTGMDVMMQDFKLFMCGDYRFGISQGNYITKENLVKAGDLVKDVMKEVRLSENLDDIYVMLTLIEESRSYLLYEGANAEEIMTEAFHGECDEKGAMELQGVVSRKKQFLPKLMEVYQVR